MIDVSLGSRREILMRKLVLAVALAATATPVVAQVHVRGYVRSDGTYVQPHVRTAPNGNPYDNWSSVPNVNPYTGREGTINPYQVPTYPRTYSPPVYAPPAPVPPPSYQPRRSGYCTYGVNC